jgi:hypothetical protein
MSMREADGSGSASCPMTVSGISGVEPSCSIIGDSQLVAVNCEFVRADYN